MANTNFIPKITKIASTWLNQINQYVFGGATVAAVRSADSTIYTRFRTLGYYSLGDGGKGDYYLDPTDIISADNGFSIFVAADGGRWKLDSSKPWNMKQAGCKCDGSTDDATRWQAGHDGIVAAGGGTYLCYGGAKMGSTLSWDPNNVGVDGDGGAFDCGSITAGTAAVNVIQGDSDINNRTQKNRAHPWRRIRLNGAVGTPTAYGFNIVDMANNLVAGVTVENCAVSGFLDDFILGQGCFFFTARDVEMTNDSAGRRSARNWINSAATNSGERNLFDNCRFGLVTTENFNQSNGNADTILQNCSFNGTNAPRCGTISGGSVKILNAHIEWTGNTDRRFVLTAGANPQLIIGNPTIVPGPGQTVNGFLSVDPAIQTTAVIITNPMVAATSPITVPWDDGSGRVIVTNPMRYGNTGYMYQPAPGQNALAYGDFESTNFTNEFTLTGTTPPGRSTVQAKSGTHSLGFSSATSGEVNTAVVMIPCDTGSTLSYSFWYYSSAITGTSASFFANMYYLDASANLATPLTTIPSIFTVSTDTGGWVLCTIVASLPPGPIGTRWAAIKFFFQGRTSGAPLGFIDLVNMVAK